MVSCYTYGQFPFQVSPLSLTDTDSLQSNDSLKDYHQFSSTRSVSVISTPTRSLHAISRIPTPTKNRTSKKKKKTLATLTFGFVGLIVLIIFGNFAISTQVKSNEDTATQKTTNTLHNNITMTAYDFTSTPNPFHCEMKWIGDGVCDDETNQFECGYDYGDCCLNEIVDTSCYKCICHIDGKNHQITTNTQIPQLLYTSLEEPKNGKKLQQLVDNF